MRRLFWNIALVTAAVALGPVAKALSVNPPSLSFSANAGTSPGSQSISVSGASGTVSYSASASGFGLTVSGGSNSGATINVQSNNTPVGSYSGSITVKDSKTSVVVGVSLQIFGVNISVAPASASVTVQSGKKTSTSFVISGGPSAISVGASGPGLTGGSANAPGSFSASVDATNLSPGPYSGTLTFSCQGGAPCVPQVVSISITVTAPPPSITVLPQSVNVTVAVGKTTQTPSITISGSSTAVTVGSNLQGLSGGSATSPGSFSATVGPFNSAGNVSGTLTFGCTPVACATQTVTVNISVTAAAPPVISVAPASVSVSVVAGQTAQTPTIVISGSSTAVQVGASGPGLSGGSANSPGSFSASVNASGLTPGSYSGTLTFSCTPVACVAQVVSVSILVTAPLSISVAPASVSVNVTAGQTARTPTIAISGSPTAVQVAASGPGLSGGSTNSPGGFTAPVDATNLAPGNYTGTLTFSCTPTACLAQVVTVNINVAQAAQLTSSRNSFTFQAYQGRTAPPGQTLALSATGGSASFSVQNVPSWLQVSPGTGTVSGSATAITVTVDPAGLTLGPNSATFSFVSASSSVSVMVSANLLKLSLSASPTQASAQLAPGQTQNIPLTIATADNGAVPVSASIATTKGGQWIKISASDFNAPGPVPTVTVDATGLSTGSYSGSITFSCSQMDCGQTPVPVSLNVTPPAPPAISQGGLVVASSFGGLKTVGPGTYIEIYGSNLASTTTDWGQFFVNGVAPTLLQGVGVKINGEAAFVDYVSPGQINALLPGDVSAGPGQVMVTNSLGSSAPFSVNVAAQQPTLFAPFTISGKQYAGALLGPDYATTFALPAGAITGVPSRAAKPGETLVIYGLGFGPVTPNVPVGTVAPGVATKLNAPLQILFGQTAVTPDYAGLVANFASLYQINVQVPQVADNDAVPVTFTLGGTPGAQTLYIAVHQ